MNRCIRCKTLTNRKADDELCTVCSGWACRCGRSKTPEQITCHRPVCKARYTKEQNRKAEDRRRILQMRRRDA